MLPVGVTSHMAEIKRPTKAARENKVDVAHSPLGEFMVEGLEAAGPVVSAVRKLRMSVLSYFSQFHSFLYLGWVSLPQLTQSVNITTASLC